ncbi:MAG TPA: pilus assembly protein PilN [Gammaproteobacteria bacterium]|jgi:type IV pilus assembly protein PilN|nr:pilus assembly protein PilN [Gammaproteobacteria bacterium]
MTKINLLPWRETYRRQKKNEFFAILLGGVFVAAGLVFGGMQYMQSKIDFQDSRNNYLNSEIQALQRELKEIKELETTKNNLLARMEIIQTLQSQRPQLVHIFHELANRLPDGIYLTSMDQNSNAMVLEGRAESNARVSALMRRLDQSDWFSKPTLEIIEADQQQGISSFKLNLTLVMPNSDEDEEMLNGS